jgi:phosphoribosylformimino-5-aminoimidazole carboxamide ribotide isomerase
MIVLPAIDLLGGRAVRLRQGSYDDVTVYNDDPVDQALLWAEGGAAWIHLVDLDGARQGGPVNLEAVRAIAGSVDVPLELGGGLRSFEDVRSAFAAGVARVVLGTALVTDPTFAAAVADTFPGRIVAGVDARDGLVAVAGWREGTAVTAAELVGALSELGIDRVIYTDISRDGMGTGIDAGAYARMARESGLPVIASGGVATLGDIEALIAEEEPGIEGVIVGRALYEGAFSLPEAIAIAAGAGSSRSGGEA